VDLAKPLLLTKCPLSSLRTPKILGFISQ